MQFFLWLTFAVLKNMKEKDIQKLTADISEVWRNFLECGIDDTKAFIIDFDFYSAKEKAVKPFIKFLEELGYIVEVKKVRTAIFLKGFELRASFLGNWTKDTLKENLEVLADSGRKFDFLLEGYGASAKLNKD